MRWPERVVFQAKGTPNPPSELAAYCEGAARRLIRLVEPSVILCLSRKAFDTVRTEKTSVINIGEARLQITSFGTIPMVRAHHPTGRWTRQHAAKSIPAAITWINRIISGNQEARLGASIAATKCPCSGTQEALPTSVATWDEGFPLSRFSFAYEAAQHILDTTDGKVSDAELNNFVLAWGNIVGVSLKNTERQNRNRVLKYRKSWLKYGHCRV